MTLSDFAVYATLALSFVCAMIAQALLLAAREHVRVVHPDWFEELGARGHSMRMGGPADRARRRLIRPLLLGPLPTAAQTDAALASLAQRLRVAMLGAALGLGALAVMITIRVQAA